MIFGTWNVRNLYGSLTTVARQLAKCKLDLLGVRKVIWDRSGTESPGDCTFSYENGNEDHELGTGFFVHKKIM
jgi:hypothetical protein